MKIRNVFILSLLLLTCATLQAQQKKPLSLDEAVNMAVNQSTEATLADTKVETSKIEVANAKNSAYPSFTVSGQYLRVTSPTINLKTSGGTASTDDGNDSSGGSSIPNVNSAMFGFASASVPVFAGGKVKNSIEASKNAYMAETFTAAGAKEQVALQTIALYSNLYKAQQSVILIKENLKSANQRVTDFTNMEENGLLARNDLLKAQLQASNIEVSLEEAKKNVAVINYQLVTLLHLPQGTEIAVEESYFINNASAEVPASADEAIAQRPELEALRYAEKAAGNRVKIEKAGYYPSLSLSAGYVYLNVPNFVELYNAANVGVGISYDLAGIFKNGKKVKAAESRREETHQQLEMQTEQVKVQVQTATENYALAIKKNRVYAKAVEQSKENYRIVKDKYDNGLVDTNDLLEADVQQLQAKLDETFSKADITQRYYELLNAAGGLTNAFNITKNN